MQVRFWGVRGSCPAPITTEDVRARLIEALRLYGSAQPQIDLNDPAAIADWLDTLPSGVSGVVGSNTACVEMRTAENDVFIIDMGSGIRALGNQLLESEFGEGKGHANIFLSHYHWDHIQGWPFFKPAYVPGNRFDLYTRHKHLRTRLKRQQEAPFFPPASWDGMRAEICFHEMNDEPLTLCDGRVRVSCLELEHPSRSYAYRFEANGKIFVYASDGAYRLLDDVSLKPVVEFFRDAHLVVFDSQFSLNESFEKRSWGHSSAVIGVELACQASAKQLALFHHDPDANDAWLEHLLQTAKDYAATVPSVQRRRPNQVELVIAREGKTITL
jgi:phosphoribosyl 1,2-cyclic phosphodiesterase